MISVRKLRLTDPAPSGLSATTAESRKRMTAAELVVAMGPLHVNHPAYRAREPKTYVPMPNLADRQPTTVPPESAFALFRALLVWVLR